jgi:hypothetical protein
MFSNIFTRQPIGKQPSVLITDDTYPAATMTARGLRGQNS